MKRASCKTCQFPLSTCICSALVTLKNQIEIWVIQTPSEVKNAKNTARIAELCLARYHALVANEPSDLAQLKQADGNKVLVYPDHPDLSLGEFIAEPTTKSIQHLVFIDTTWPKSYKILKNFPYLHTLPRLCFETLTPSGYLIRKTRRSHSMSTLEAIAQALETTEQLNCKPLRLAQQKFVEQFTKHMPNEVKQRYFNPPD